MKLVNVPAGVLPRSGVSARTTLCSAAAISAPLLTGFARVIVCGPSPLTSIRSRRRSAGREVAGVAPLVLVPATSESLALATAIRTRRERALTTLSAKFSASGLTLRLSWTSTAAPLCWIDSLNSSPGSAVPSAITASSSLPQTPGLDALIVSALPGVALRSAIPTSAVAASLATRST